MARISGFLKKAVVTAQNSVRQTDTRHTFSYFGVAASLTLNSYITRLDRY